MPGVVTAGRLVDDRYRLLEPIEEGGMGILWRAEDLISERYVTVKELRFPDPLDHMQRRALAARVRREARAMAAVEHPGLARILDVVDDGDRPWVVTELVDAPTLAQLVARDGPMEPEKVAVLGIRLLDVLEAATDQAMVHRFLQPSKVFVGPSGEVRLADFGIASLIGDPSVARDGAVGGVSFMAPEQAGTSEADVWSLGAVLYYAVEGVPPFTGKSSTAILEAVASEPPRPPAAAGPLAGVLDVTLQKDPSERPSLEELRALLCVAAGPLAPKPEPELDDTIHWGDGDSEGESSMDLGLDPVEGAPASTSAPASAPASGPGPGPGGNGQDGQGGQGAATSLDEAAADEPAEELPPPTPLPPREALARMFSPDPGRPPVIFTPEEEHREPSPPWPVPRRRGTGVMALCGLIVLAFLAILITNGRGIFTDDARSNRIISSVSWTQYTDPDTGFRIDHPTDWVVTRDGRYTDFRHPDAAAALRVSVQDANRRSPEAIWLGLEEQFREQQPSYSRIRVEPTTFRGFDAAEWEFTYTRSDVGLHNLDLGVVTGRTFFSLNFEARASNWGLVRPFFDRFQSSFRPPRT